jgi:uncharacterized protein
VILDTNVFVAAGFKPHSTAARIVAAVRAGRLAMVWSEATRRETQTILEKIPRLSWTSAAGLFLLPHRAAQPSVETGWEAIPDPADRKFAALCQATSAVLVTSDSDLLDCRALLGLPIATPSEFAAKFMPLHDGDR